MISAFAGSPLTGHFTLIGFVAAGATAGFFASAGALNSTTLAMKSSGLAANLPQQPFQQNPITWPL